MTRTWLFAALLIGATAWPGRAQSPVTEEIPAEIAATIDAGLQFLVSTQRPDGSWVEGIGRRINYDYHIHATTSNVGVTALALMAFLANGSTPGRGTYGIPAEKAMLWLIEHQSDGGFITWSGSRMYSHAFATLALAEVYGMTSDDRVVEPLKRAVQRIVTGQNEGGGWRYLPGSMDSDISVTVCTIMALRAARNAGIDVPWETLDKAIKYVRRSAVRESKDFGGFYYQADENLGHRKTRVTFPLTAAGVCALYGAGEYNAPEIEPGLNYLENERPPAIAMQNTFDYFYGHYYAVQCFYQAGGTRWKRWWPSVRDEISRGQLRNGSWMDGVGPNYATAMACVILQIPYRYLPIFER